MSGQSVTVKSVAGIEQVASYLEEVTRSLRAGKLCISFNGESIALDPAGMVEFELEAGEKKGKQKLSLELEWRVVLEPKAENLGLVIGTELPDPPAPEQPPLLVSDVEDTSLDD